MEFEETFSESPAARFRRLLDRTDETLGHATHVEEWLGPRQRLPVFDVNVIGDFAAESENRQPLCY